MISDRCSETMHVMHVECEMAVADCSALIHMTATSLYIHYISYITMSFRLCRTHFAGTVIYCFSCASNSKG